MNERLKFSSLSFQEFDGGNDDIHYRCYMAILNHFGIPCILSEKDIQILDGMNEGFVVGFHKELRHEKSLSLFSSIIGAIKKHGVILITYSEKQ